MALPVLTASDLRALRSMPKPVPDDWQQMVWPVPNLASPSSQGRLDFHPPDLPSNERMHIYARLDQGRLDSYSCGVVYEDAGGNTYRLVRCNGNHAAHHNRLEHTSIPAVTPHVHYVREMYLRAIQSGQRVDPEGFAIRAFHFNLRSALEGLARRVNLQVKAPQLLRARSLP
jgi:hypothetical protein